MEVSKTSFVSAKTVEFDRISTRDLFEHMEREKNLSPVSKRELEKSYRDGNSVLMVTNELKAVGHIRFRPLLDEAIQKKLGINHCPEIWELASSYLGPTYRGHFTEMRLEILKIKVEEIKAGEFCTIGVTNFASSITSMHKNSLSLRREEGVDITYFAYDSRNDLRFEMLNSLIIFHDSTKVGAANMDLDYETALKKFDRQDTDLIERINGYFSGKDGDVSFLHHSQRFSNFIPIVSKREIAERINHRLKEIYQTPQKFLNELLKLRAVR